MKPIRVFSVFLPLLFVACPPPGDSGMFLLPLDESSSGAATPTASCTDPCSITISWQRSREGAVRNGGGYRVCHSTSPSFNDPSEATCAPDILDGGAAPDVLTLSLNSADLGVGKHYVKVFAYGTVLGSERISAPSAEAIVKFK